MPLRYVPEFLQRLRNLQILLATHHGNYRGTYLASLLEAQGLALVGADGAAFDHRANMLGFSNGLANQLRRIDFVLQAVQTAELQAGTLLASGVGPLIGLARGRHELAQQTELLAARLAADPADSGRLAGAPTQPRGRGAGGTVAGQLAALRARTGWAPTTGGDVVSPQRMADPDTQSLLARIEEVPVDGPGAEHETHEAAAKSRQLIASFASRYRGQSDTFNGYAAALERHWTPHGSLDE